MSEEQAVRQLEAAVPIVEVTLLEDRALVVRRGIVELPPGRSRLEIADVAPVLVDKTLAAELCAPEGGAELPEELRVRSVGIERWRVTCEADRPLDVQAVTEQIRSKQRARSELDQARAGPQAEIAALESLVGLTLEEINEDVGWGRQDQRRWGEQLDQLGARLQELGRERQRLHHQAKLIQRDIEDLRTLREHTGKLDSVATAKLSVELMNAESITRRVELRIDYLVPGALWRPWHTARLIEGEAGEAERVEFRTDGAVWQATGEDWSEVQLIFSTERPSLGVTPPLLTTDTLHKRKKSSTVEVQSREQTVHTAGLGAEEERARETEVAEDELPGIDDGGEALELRGRVKVSVPGDGRPHRVPIFEFASEAETALVCAPELVRSVMLRSRQANQAAHPILAGPVDLIRRSGLVGRTSTLFVAPGEHFELGWGPDASLRVHREVEHLDHERKMMSSWIRKPRRVTVKLSNLAPEAKAVEIRERISVSEVEKVEVELVEASLGQKADEDGFVTWSVELPGFGHDELELRWTMVVHDDVVGA